MPLLLGGMLITCCAGKAILTEGWTGCTGQGQLSWDTYAVKQLNSITKVVSFIHLYICEQFACIYRSQ